MNRTKIHLFYTFLGVYAATAVVTLLAFLNFVPIRDGFFALLVGIFLAETVAVVVVLSRRTVLVSEPEVLEESPIPSATSKVPLSEKPREENPLGPRRLDVEERIMAHVAAAKVCKIADIVTKFGIS